MTKECVNAFSYVFLPNNALQCTYRAVGYLLVPPSCLGYGTYTNAVIFLLAACFIANILLLLHELLLHKAVNVKLYL